MNLHHKIEKHTDTKLKFLIDSDTISKDKRYKLGEWLHGEYRNKVSRNERANNLIHFKAKAEQLTV
jgi:hypothetical protein